MSLWSWQGKVFAVEGKTVTVISQQGTNVKIGSKLYIIRDGQELGQGRVERTFHTKIELKLIRGIAEKDNIVSDQKTRIDEDLFSAAEHGNLKRIEELIAAGADVNEQRGRGNGGETALMRAAFHCHASVTKRLIAAGANVHVVNEYGSYSFDGGFTALSYAIHDGEQCAEIVKQLIDAGAEVNVAEKNKWDAGTPLTRASYDGAADIVRMLIAAKADLYAKDTFNHMPHHTGLIIAAKKGHAEVVKLFIAAKVDLNYGAPDDTPLGIAAYYNKTDVVRLLIDAGADVNVNNHNCSPLHNTTQYGSTESAMLLIAAGARLNVKCNYNDQTELMYAAQNGHVELVKFLIKAGADLNAKSKDGNTALMFAKQRNHRNIVELLKLTGAKE